MSKGLRAPMHCEVHGHFLPDECMSPAYFDKAGVLHFATYAPDPPVFSRKLDKQWEDTVCALGFVTHVIAMRQNEIDKKEYFTDPILQELRKRALAIHNRRIAINVSRLNQERSKKVLDHSCTDVRE